MTRTWPDLLTSLVTGQDLDRDGTSWAMGEILSGAATPVQVAGFMVALQAKGATPDELNGLVSAMLANARPISLPSREAVDIVGTGGDRANTVNVSTMAALVATAAGAKVVKHGNRAASSACGTADCLEELGVVLDLDPAVQGRVFDEAGIVFLFASHYHPSLRHAAVPRRELGIRTTFNFLGPLANPARPLAQAIGVADLQMAELVASVLADRGNRAASSACGTADCLEELGVVLDLDPAVQGRVFDEAGIVFLFASHYHPSLRHAAVPRRELGIRTTFNFLGPLANPARPLAQAIGVADRQMAELVASVLADRGNRGLVFHGGDGLDELTTTTTSDVWVVGGGRVVRTTLDPLDLGIPRTTKDSLVGGGPPHNAQVVRDTFAGQPGPVRDIVLLNAAAAILAFEGPDPDADLAGQLVGPLERAAAAVDSGAATAVLERWVALTRDLAA